MFTGEFYCKIDAKGRLILPVKLREKLENNEITLSRGYSKNIEIYTSEEWNKIEEEMKKLNPLVAKDRQYIHFMTSAAEKIEIDNQGRINIPQSLIQFSGLKKEVVVIGNLTTIQIWDKEKWDIYINNTIDNIPDILKELGA